MNKQKPGAGIEVWKDIPGYEGVYQVSNWGNVKRLAGSQKCKADRILKQNIRTNGYVFVSLCKDANPVDIDIHRLVMWAFIGKQGDLWVNHLNGIKNDNTLANLEYTTPGENTKHAYDTGLHELPYGSKNGMAKLTEDDVWAIRAAAVLCFEDIGGYVGLAKRYGVSKTTITEIINKHLWPHVEVSL